LARAEVSVIIVIRQQQQAIGVSKTLVQSRQIDGAVPYVGIMNCDSDLAFLEHLNDM
jgi:hypothetical protein